MGRACFFLYRCGRCPSGLSFPSCLGGQVILTRTDDLGTGRVGRKRAGWILGRVLPRSIKQGARIALAARETVPVGVGRVPWHLLIQAVV